MALPTACTNSNPPQDQINTGVEICGKIEIRFHCPRSILGSLTRAENSPFRTIINYCYAPPFPAPTPPSSSRSSREKRYRFLCQTQHRTVVLQQAKEETLSEITHSPRGPARYDQDRLIVVWRKVNLGSIKNF